jgi:hypothetical protein
LPSSAADAPELLHWVGPFMEAFNVLSAGRGYGTHGEPQAIGLPAIAAYLDIYGIADADDRADLVELVQELDREFLAIGDERLRKASA